MQIVNVLIPILFVLTFASGLYAGTKLSMNSYKLGWRAGHASRSDTEVLDITMDPQDPPEFQVLDKQDEDNKSTNVMSE